ncbi:hypothetical protein [Streptomyces cuspidosporus]|uniref:Flavin reductase like domain-containing protein n=1 Tax=Streptomyces cuspidosporus TaxID=66882 RepID=A0ABP5SB45_9ACTN
MSTLDAVQHADRFAVHVLGAENEQIGEHYLVIGEVPSGGGPARSPALVHHDGAFATAVRLAAPNTR